MRRILIIDANNLLHRVLHIENYRKMRSENGQFTGGVFGVLRSLNKLARQHSPLNKIVVVWDCGKSKRRLDLFPDYKKRAPITVDDEDGFDYYKEFLGQQKILTEFFRTLGIRNLMVNGFEADDLVWKVIEMTGKNMAVSIISEDRDFFQLVSKNVSVIRPIAGEFMTRDMFKVKYEFDSDRFVLYKAIVGDNSDNIAGVKGIGHVTAQKIVLNVKDQYIDSIYEFCHNHSSSLVRKAGTFEALALIDRNLGLVDLKLQDYTKEELELIDRVLNSRVHRSMRDFDRLVFKCEFSDYSQSWFSSFMHIR